jgi:hypothetical protein
VAICSGAGWCNAAESAAEQKVRAELAKPTQVEFNETTLKDALDYLEQLHAINIEIDRKALEEANVQVDTPVTRVLKGTTLASALKLVLGELGITYVVENEVLLITSLAAAQRTSKPRVHRVSELASNDEERAALLKALELVLDPPAIDPAGNPIEAASRLRIVRDKLVLRGSEPEHERLAELLLRLREPGPRSGEEPASR